ncbi:MAG TPA: hypothetical protein VFH88_10960, partial [Candidatus Krumholzibacteria bacterium]|nr:hypothetical protein [Candidatus Krumholzibacteria bacterium]
LYYAGPGAIMQVDVTTSPTLQLGTPRPVLDIAKNHIEIGRVATFDVTPGGKRFMVSVGSESTRRPRFEITVVENWLSEFKAAQMAKK